MVKVLDKRIREEIDAKLVSFFKDLNSRVNMVMLLPTQHGLKKHSVTVDKAIDIGWNLMNEELKKYEKDRIKAERTKIEMELEDTGIIGGIYEDEPDSVFLRDIDDGGV